MRDKFNKEKFKPEFYEMLDRALALRNEKRYDEAVDVLQEIIKCCPDFPYAYGHLGDVFWRQEKLQEANHYFQETTRLLPKSQLASLGVFHTFWNMDMFQLALNEIKRFKEAGGKCKDYEEIVAELIEKQMIDENLNLI